ncbi:MAG: hypothetical protein JWR62_989, partial [Modestobacter sp.]|nr:hypothetical protein [Modestobacter sp.]
QAWNAARRDWLDRVCCLTFTGAADPAAVVVALEEARAPLRAEAAALAALRYAPSTTPLPPLKDWESTLTPTTDLDFDVVCEWVDHRLLAIHPATDLAAISWNHSANDAITAANGDPQALPAPADQGFYPRLVSLYSQHGTSLGTAAERLDAGLAERLTPARLTADRQEALLDLVAALIAAEAVRYFDFQISVHNLPPVPDNHRARLLDAAARLGAVRTLGEGYSVAWRAASAAATAAQRQPYAPKVNMTTHGVNQFESLAQRATDPTTSVPSYREDNRVPLSPLTRTVFHTILGVEPMITSRPEISRLLPEPAPVVQTQPQPATKAESEPVEFKTETPEEQPAFEEPVVSPLMLQLLANPPQPYDPAAVRKALELVANGDIDPDSTLRRVAQTVIEVFDAVAACTTEPYAPVVAAAAAINLVSNEPATTGDDTSPIYRGEILAQAVDVATNPEGV